MRECFRGLIVRCTKLAHYLLTVALFWMFYYKAGVCLSVDSGEMMNQGTAVLIYALVLLFGLRSYSAYNIGLDRVRMLVYSQTLADLVSAGVLYMILAVDRMSLFNPVPMLLLLAAQFVLNCCWGLLANALYFWGTEPRKTLIVYRNETDLSRMDEVYRYERKFRVTGKLKTSASDIRAVEAALEGYEAIFVTGVNATLRNGIAKYCVENNIRCYISPHVGDVIMMGARHIELFSVPVLRVMRKAPDIEYMIIKRCVDMAVSLLGIVLLSPVMLITALAVKLCDGGPVLYKQVRLTKDGKEFNILKFRSMRVNAEKDGVARLAAENDSRITPVGKVIRACRLDELPQLFNILKGDMSIVGPRPERPEIAKQYEQVMPAFSLRLQVRAGLTGFAQIYGKYNSDPYDKLRMDLMYINQMSLLEDLKLMLATVKVLFMKESTHGIAEGQVTAAVEQEEKEEEYAPV